jgi:hypothetical protein
MTSSETKEQQNRFASKFLTPPSPSDAEIHAVAHAHKASYASSLLALRSNAPDEQEDYCIAVKSPKQKSLSGTTTARKLKESKTQTKIKIRGRVYTARKLIIHLQTDDAQKATLMHFEDNHQLYSTVLWGTTVLQPIKDMWWRSKFFRRSARRVS